MGPRPQVQYTSPAPQSLIRPYCLPHPVRLMCRRLRTGGGGQTRGEACLSTVCLGASGPINGHAHHHRLPRPATDTELRRPHGARCAVGRTGRCTCKPPHGHVPHFTAMEAVVSVCLLDMMQWTGLGTERRVDVAYLMNPQFPSSHSDHWVYHPYRSPRPSSLSSSLRRLIGACGGVSQPSASRYGTWSCRCGPVP